MVRHYSCHVTDPKTKCHIHNSTQLQVVNYGQIARNMRFIEGDQITFNEAETYSITHRLKRLAHMECPPMAMPDFFQTPQLQSDKDHL